jgi:hypothetical protein
MYRAFDRVWPRTSRFMLRLTPRTFVSSVAELLWSGHRLLSLNEDMDLISERCDRRRRRNSPYQSRLVRRRARKTGQHTGVLGPGATAFTRIPELAISSATDLVMPSTACLLPT